MADENQAKSLLETSILDSVKKVLGMDPSYTAFDMDVLMHINSALATLNQVGIGPDRGFLVMDNSSKWESVLDDDPNLLSAISYVWIQVRILFDPPQTSFALDAMKKQADEFLWRLNVRREGVKYPSTVTAEP